MHTGQNSASAPLLLNEIQSAHVTCGMGTSLKWTLAEFSGAGNETNDQSRQMPEFAPLNGPEAL